MKYAIKVRNRYISYCSKKFWYETSIEPLFIFDKERALEVVNELYDKYVYRVTIIGEDGSVESHSAFSKDKINLPKSEKEHKVGNAKITGFVLKKRIF